MQVHCSTVYGHLDAQVSPNFHIIILIGSFVPVLTMEHRPLVLLVQQFLSVNLLNP